MELSFGLVLNFFVTLLVLHPCTSLIAELAALVAKIHTYNSGNATS